MEIAAAVFYVLVHIRPQHAPAFNRKDLIRFKMVDPAEELKLKTLVVDPNDQIYIIRQTFQETLP